MLTISGPAILAFMLFLSSVFLLFASISTPKTGILPMWIQPGNKTTTYYHGPTMHYSGEDSVYYVYGSCERNSTSGPCVPSDDRWSFHNIEFLFSDEAGIIDSGMYTHPIACICSFLALFACTAWAKVARPRGRAFDQLNHAENAHGCRLGVARPRVHAFDQQNQVEEAKSLRKAATGITWFAAIVAFIGLVMDLNNFGLILQNSEGPTPIFGACLGVMIAAVVLLFGAAIGITCHCLHRESVQPSRETQSVHPRVPVAIQL